MDCPLTLQIAASCTAAVAMLSAWGRLPRLTAILLLTAAALGAFYLVRLLYSHWPYTPMYMESKVVFTLLGLFYFYPMFSGNYKRRVSLVLASMVMFITISFSILFPKDFYIPGPRSVSLYSHVFTWADALARSTLIAASIETISYTIRRLSSKNVGHPPLSPLVALGFFFLTVAMASGVLLSINVLGMPISFHDSHALGFLFLWCYWASVLHIPFLKKGAILYHLAIAMGGVLTFSLTIHEDMGVWRPIW